MRPRPAASGFARVGALAALVVPFGGHEHEPYRMVPAQDALDHTPIRAKRSAVVFIRGDVIVPVFFFCSHSLYSPRPHPFLLPITSDLYVGSQPPRSLVASYRAQKRKLRGDGSAPGRGPSCDGDASPRSHSARSSPSSPPPSPTTPQPIPAARNTVTPASPIPPLRLVFSPSPPSSPTHSTYAPMPPVSSPPKAAKHHSPPAVSAVLGQLLPDGRPKRVNVHLRIPRYLGRHRHVRERPVQLPPLR